MINLGELTSLTTCPRCGFSIPISANEEYTKCKNCEKKINLKINDMFEGEKEIMNIELTKTRGFEVVKDEKRKTEGEITLPTRGTKDSAGYDFYSTETFTIKPQESKLIWSDVKAYMQIGEVLEIYVRSSIGINKHLMLSNLTGIIDADYYSNPKNDGNIGICLFNYGNEEITIEEGERIAQGIFKQFLVSDNGNTDEERIGGTGSTNK